MEFNLTLKIITESPRMANLPLLIQFAPSLPPDYNLPILEAGEVAYAHPFTVSQPYRAVECKP